MSFGRPPNYYAILEVSETATTTQIRDAYKRAALKTHPDRVPSDSPERPERTRKFQLVNDAYYTLSDPTRRREYDAQRKLFGGGTSSSRPSGGANNKNSGNNMPGGFNFDPFSEENTGTSPGTTGGGAAGNNAYSWAWNFFTGQGGQNTGSSSQQEQQQREQTEEAQFADVFEEMLREEGMAEEAGPNGRAQPTSKFWGVLGGISGGALGFIVANVPGMVAGVVAGNRLGAIRDAKGKSVYAVFQELPQADRARLLSQLAAKVFSHVVGV